jgi:putative colanic acid biosynthesis acetyltransferase WcaF
MGKTDLSKFTNEWYDTGAGTIKKVLWYIVNVIFFKSGFPVNGIKVQVLRSFGAIVGNQVVIKPFTNIKYPWKLSIGNNVWIGESVWIDNLAYVTIEDHVCLSQGAFLLCGNHNYKKESFDLIVKEIKLQQGVWIGAKSIVCPGVTCNTHAVLTAGSIATKDLDSYGVYTGNPAVKIRERVIENE